MEFVFHRWRNVIDYTLESHTRPYTFYTLARRTYFSTFLHNILINFYCFFLLLLFLPKKSRAFIGFHPLNGWAYAMALKRCNRTKQPCVCLREFVRTIVLSYKNRIGCSACATRKKNNSVFDFCPFLRQHTAQSEQIWIWLSVERRFGYWISGVHMLSDSTYPWWCAVHNIVRICCHKAAPGHTRSRDILY